MGHDLKLHLGINDVPYSRSYAPQRTRVGGTLRPARPPAGDNRMSTGDVAEILEARYGIMQFFWDRYGDEIREVIADALRGRMENQLMGAPTTDELLPVGSLSKVEEMFRSFLDNREMDGRVAGVPTGAARMGVSHRMLHPYARRAERPSFIDTGQYSTHFRAFVTE